MARDFTTKNGPTIIFCANSSNNFVPAFNRLAASHSDYFRFIQLDPAACEPLHFEPSQFLFVQHPRYAEAKFEKSGRVLTADSASELERLIEIAAVPLVGEFTETQQEVLSNKGPACGQGIH